MENKFDINDDFFSDINIKSAYWAGFIAADGFVTNNNICFTIHKKDRCLLENFIKDVETNYKIFDDYYESKCRLVVNSPVMVYDLWNLYNINRNKSQTLQPPKITDIENIMSFIVGYIDGDGHIKIENTKTGKILKSGKESVCRRLCLEIKGTEEFLSWVRDISKNNDIKILKSKGIYSFSLTGKRAYSFLNPLYNIPVEKLDRKWSYIKEANAIYKSL